MLLIEDAQLISLSIFHRKWHYKNSKEQMIEEY